MKSPTLYKHFPWYYSVFMVVGFVVNIAILLVSQLGDSAVIKSSICVGSTCSSSNVIQLNQTNACNNSNDLLIFSEGSAAPIYVDNEATQRALGQSCSFDALQDFDLCVELFNSSGATDDPNTPEVEYFTEECIECFIANFICSARSCAAACIESLTQPALPECVDCTVSKCVPAFDTCSGVVSPPYDPFTVNRSVPIPPPDTDYLCTSRLENGITMFEVFIIRFLESVELAWNGEAKFLAVFVAVASGIWPHVKNILMAIAWFAPIGEKHRDRILYTLAYIGKWSLVDVFFVVLLLVGIRIDKQLGLSPSSSIIVLAEARIAICLFGTAAIMALLQGEYIRHLERVLEADEVKEEPKTVENATIMDVNAYAKKQYFVAFFGLAAFALGVFGVSSINTKFSISGIIEDQPGPNVFEYSALDFALSQTGACAFDCVGARCDNQFIGGTYYLAIMFTVMGIFLPLITYLVAIAAALIPLYHPKRKVVHQLFKSMSYFSAMDVFFFSMIILIAQFTALINSAIRDSVDEQCGVEEGEVCLEFDGTLQIGTWSILASVICFWITQFGVATLLAGDPVRSIENKM